ncbi:hypothetical protein RX512_002011 [Providencia rettgeri]|nr:hypothetical protein [Providencia rettgeri]MCY0800727.1 hypothetical protein [Providencia rettgeri]
MRISEYELKQRQDAEKRRREREEEEHYYWLESLGLTPAKIPDSHFKGDF